ncbi:MAG: DUF368 domain-containing protein [Acidimicrobiales bacterium]
MTMTSTTPSTGRTAAMQLVRGFCMGMADIVPGVSGGTIALIFGIYQRLIDNIRTGARALGSLVKLDVRGAIVRLREVEWLFLVPLGAGVLAALVSLSHLIEGLLEDHPEEMAGLFLGLVGASVIIAGQMVSTWDTRNLAIVAVVSVVAFAALGLKSGAVEDPSLLVFFGAGTIAICAMILPGISGSFLLLMMGMYAPVLGAVTDRDIVSLLAVAVGATLGLALFSSLLGWMLHNHADPLLAAVIGLMIGSVRVLWPWPNGVGVVSDVEEESISGTALGWPESFASFAWPSLLAAGAFAFVLGLSIYAERRARGVAGTVPADA